MKYVDDRPKEQRRPYANPEKAARRLMEHAFKFEPIQDGRIYIEVINGPFILEDKATPAEYRAGLNFAIERGWLEPVHESGTFHEDDAGWQGPICLTDSQSQLGLPIFRLCPSPASRSRSRLRRRASSRPI